MLVIHETEPASYGWATVKNSNTNTMFDVVREDPSDTHPQLEGWIQRDFAVELFKDAGLDFETLKKQARSRDFRPVELEGGTFSAKYDVASEVITSYNTVRRIEGSQRPDETVLSSGHWDHLGAGAPHAEGDRINKGALYSENGQATQRKKGR